MESRAGTGTDQYLKGTRRLLGLGLVAGPFYLAVGIAQGLMREGFDFSRHALSHLANGPGGWMQTANFAITGILVLATAFGLARVLHTTSRAASGFLGAYGACILLAAFFPADPVDGFPPGTPAGMPTSISTLGLIHFILGMLGFICVTVSCFVTGRALSRRGTPDMARFSIASGGVIILGFFGGPFLGPAGILGIWIAVVAGWAWLGVVSAHLSRTLK